MFLSLLSGTPSVMICPTTFWHHMQHAEEYRQKPLVGAALRWVRFVAVMTSLFLLPLWYIFATNTDLLPERLRFIGPEQIGHFSLFWQFFIAEFGIEMLRMAAIHTPSALATALGLVAAILIGDIAVQVGLFSNEVVLYLAIAVIGTFATPSYELSLANRLSRVFFLSFPPCLDRRDSSLPSCCGSYCSFVQKRSICPTCGRLFRLMAKRLSTFYSARQFRSKTSGSRC